MNMKNLYANMSVEQKQTMLNTLQKKQKEKSTKKIIIALTVIEAIISLLYILFGDAISYLVGNQSIVSVKFKELSEISSSDVSLLSIIYIPFLILTLANVCCLYFIVKYPLNDQKNVYVNYLSLASFAISILLFFGSVLAMNYANSLSTWLYKAIPLTTPMLCCLAIAILKFIPGVLHNMYLSRDKAIKNLKSSL